MKPLLLTHPDCEKHAMPGHPERPERLSAVMERLQADGLVAEFEQRLATSVTTNDLALVHPHSFIEQVANREPDAGLIKLDPDTYMGPGSLRAAHLAAGACAEAVRAVVSGQHQRAFCAIRPPGHHAELAEAMGFCLFNNVAVAARVALTMPGIARVAILDFDVHHCNGTVDIFQDDERVLVCSSFQDNYYPNRYLDFSNEHIIPVPLPAGSTGNDFRRAIEQRWIPAVTQHRPDLILISAGFDAHQDDPLAALNLTEADYTWVTQLVADMANQHARGRIISTLEGGYNLESLSASAAAHVAALMDS